MEPPTKQQGFRSSALRRPLSLREGDSRILADPDSSVRSFDSLSERRALFGRESLYLYKVQSGVVVQPQRMELSIKAGPRSVQFAGRVFDGLETLQTVGFFHGASAGYFRRVRLRNGAAAPVKVRLIDVADPTAAQFGEALSRWGALGLNAFNRGSHIAMDEVSGPSSARVFGSQPSPSRFYMTTDRARLLGFLRTGELPDAVAGMSGQVLIASVHDLELAPGETTEITYASICNPSKLEAALTDFGRLEEGSKPGGSAGPSVLTSSTQVTDAAAWALAQLEGAPGKWKGLDGSEVLSALCLANPEGAVAVIDLARSRLSKEGWLPHSQDPTVPGLLESAVFLQALSRYLHMSADGKLVRARYPTVKKMAGFLMAVSKDHAVRPNPLLPQGWRRSLGTGFPAGEIPEVSLAVAGALAGASEVARRLSKSDDATRFRERSEMIAEGVRTKFLDEHGYLALCLDTKGRLRDDETIDSALASYRHPFNEGSELAAAHRLLEKDFDTPYGPRTVPRSNGVYFNGTYGSGQLGGYWTRASLAHALLCYRLGLGGIGSLSVQKVAKLVTEDVVKLGGTVGEFPLWVDLEAGEAHGEESDEVAAARLIEALCTGELGLSMTPDAISISPSPSSALKWVLVTEVWLGDRASVFVGRGSGRAVAFAAPARMKTPDGTAFAKAETLEPPARGVAAVSFSVPGQVICMGNSSAAPSQGTVNFSPRAPELSTTLTASLDAFDPARGTWGKVGSLRVLPRMSFDASLGPGEWKAFRVSSL